MPILRRLECLALVAFVLPGALLPSHALISEKPSLVAVTSQGSEVEARSRPEGTANAPATTDRTTELLAVEGRQEPEEEEGSNKKGRHDVKVTIGPVTLDHHWDPFIESNWTDAQFWARWIAGSIVMVLLFIHVNLFILWYPRMFPRGLIFAGKACFHRVFKGTAAPAPQSEAIWEGELWHLGKMHHENNKHIPDPHNKEQWKLHDFYISDDGMLHHAKKNSDPVVLFGGNSLFDMDVEKVGTAHCCMPFAFSVRDPESGDAKPTFFAAKDDSTQKHLLKIIEGQGEVGDAIAPAAAEEKGTPTHTPRTPRTLTRESTKLKLRRAKTNTMYMNVVEWLFGAKGHHDSMWVSFKAFLFTERPQLWLARPYQYGNGECSIFMTTVNIVNLIVGTGLLTIAFMLRLGGLGALMPFTMMVLVNWFTATLIYKVLDLCVLNDKSKAVYSVERDWSYMGQMALGDWGKSIVYFFYRLKLWMIMCTFLVFNGEAFQMVFGLTSVLPGIYITAILCVLLMLLPWTHLSYLSFVALCAPIVAFALFVWTGLSLPEPAYMGGVSWTKPVEGKLYMGLNWDQLNTVMGMSVAVMTVGHAVLPTFFHQMRDPTRFNEAIGNAFSIGFVYFFTVAVFGYFFFGDALRVVWLTNIGKDTNYNPIPGMESTQYIAQLMFIFKVMTVVPLCAGPQVAHLELDFGVDPVNGSVKWRLGLSIGLLGIGCVFSTFMRHYMGVVFVLNACMGGVFIVLILPVVCFCVMYPGNYIQKALGVIILIYGMNYQLIGTYVTLKETIIDYFG